MTVSLRWRVLCVVAVLNAVVFGVGGVFLSRNLESTNARLIERRTVSLLEGLGAAIRPNQVNVGYILRSFPWEALDDAVLVDDSLIHNDSGEIQVGGIYLNPVGRVQRPAHGDEQRILEAIEQAMKEGRRVQALGGAAVPIQLSAGAVTWGGWWYRTQSAAELSEAIPLLAPWFLLSTGLLTLGTFLAMRRLVLAPVEQLAEGARRVRSGDFSVHLEEPERRDEVADLVRSFNAMTVTVRDFNVYLEEEVQKATDQARRAEAAAMTQRRLAAMGEFAAGIAHEINNPLGGLQNAVETLNRDDIDAERRARYTDLLRRGLERIGETVRRLQRFTPREADEVPVDLAAVIKDALDLVRHRAERLGVALVFDAPSPRPWMLGARTELAQAVLNLCANAIDALEEEGSSDPAGPRLEVTLRGDAEGIHLGVRDNGPGVEAEELERVDDLFYTTKEVGKGTGLGLALVHNAVRAHDGDVRIHSERGRFFAVELEFPPERVVPPAPPPPSPPPPRSGPSNEAER